ncbi:MAG TPA: bifunctional phosphopantothenoylcysteine decarboxylase/phosphopantothenate--cysteine ligase CoaBC, partial [Thermoplasmata archaeon]|nr:bifunctional phosphopantothenoylcysteine decarboxylase/phosphopantothenate--cysteine ligase CoaBC [Thermoplasmata archaeon]
RGARSRLLEGRRVVLGVSGSIAAVEAPRIARELIRHGADVVAVMSREATRIVTPEALTFATGHPVITELTGDVEHVTLLGPGAGRADLLLIAPATANTLSKVAHGIDDTAVTSCASVALGGGVPLLLAPAMHAHMGLNPAVRENLERLRSWGVGIIAPVEAEGEEKIPPPETVAAAVLHRLAGPPWAGRRLVVIGGASRERIDAVRSITNESSGETAIALATQGYFRGADVELWSGGMRRSPPPFVPVRPWHSVADLLTLARERAGDLRSAAAIVVPAALSDFTMPARAGKIPSHGVEGLTLNLTRAPKVLPELRRIAGAGPRLVGFKLEAIEDRAELAGKADELLTSVPLDAVVANPAKVLGEDRTEVLWMDGRGQRRWLEGPKTAVAGELLDGIGAILGPGAGERTSPDRAADTHRRRPPGRGRAPRSSSRRRPGRPT